MVAYGVFASASLLSIAHISLGVDRVPEKVECRGR